MGKAADVIRKARAEIGYREEREGGQAQGDRPAGWPPAGTRVPAPNDAPSCFATDPRSPFGVFRPRIGVMFRYLGKDRRDTPQPEGESVRARLAASAAAAASLLMLLGAGAPAAMADNGPLVKSNTQSGVSIGGLLDAGARQTVNGTDTKTSTDVDAAGVVSSDVDAGVALNLPSILLGAMAG